MTKGCTRQVYVNNIKQVATFFGRISVRLELAKFYVLLTLYEYFLLFKDSFRTVLFPRKLPKIKIAKSAPPPQVQAVDAAV